MTSARYIFCRMAQAFGYTRKNVRLSEAASEIHLLKEAESQLGRAVWREVENIEELSIEYWNLRKLIKERDRVADELDASIARLATAHEERAELLGVSDNPFQELLNERQTVLRELESLTRDRDMIVEKAREIRRLHDGLKTKEEVLASEGGQSRDELGKLTERLAELKEEFSDLKEVRLAVAEKISDGEAKIDAIDAEVQDRKRDRRSQASEAFQHIGDANQEISTLRAELGVLDTQMRQLFSEIGRHVSLNAGGNPECRKASAHHKGLVDVMAALRKSITLNHKLSENA